MRIKVAILGISAAAILADAVPIRSQYAQQAADIQAMVPSTMAQSGAEAETENVMKSMMDMGTKVLLALINGAAKATSSAFSNGGLLGQGGMQDPCCNSPPPCNTSSCQDTNPLPAPAIEKAYAGAPCQAPPHTMAPQPATPAATDPYGAPPGGAPPVPPTGAPPPVAPPIEVPPAFPQAPPSAYPAYPPPPPPPAPPASYGSPPPPYYGAPPAYPPPPFPSGDYGYPPPPPGYGPPPLEYGEYGSAYGYAPAGYGPPPAAGPTECIPDPYVSEHWEDHPPVAYTQLDTTEKETEEEAED